MLKRTSETNTMLNI